MKFTLNPMPGEAGFLQWKDAMKALARLPGGVPKEFRKSVSYFYRSSISVFILKVHII
jgi:hypothetical protein